MKHPRKEQTASKLSGRQLKSPEKQRSGQLSLLKAQPRHFGGQLLVGKRRRARPLSQKEPIHFVWKSAWAKGGHSFLNLKNKTFCEKTIRRWAKRHGVRVYRMAIAPDHIHIVLRITNRPLYRSFIRVTTSQIASHVMNGESFENFAAKSEAAENRAVADRTVRNGTDKNINVKNGASKNGTIATVPSVNSTVNGRGAGTRTVNGKVKETRVANSEPRLQLKEQRFWQFRPFSRVMTWGKDFKATARYLIQNTLEALGHIPYTPRGVSRYAREILNAQRIETS